MRQIYFVVFFIIWNIGVADANPLIKYHLSFEEPQTHYVKVQMDVQNWKGNVLNLKMPVWTPGSYLVREFSRFVERVKITDGEGRPLRFEKYLKNGWRVTTNEISSVKIEYYVYAYELSVRNCFVDDEHAYLNGACLFLYIDKAAYLPSTVEVKPNASWKKISTALERVDEGNPWMLKASNYDELIDAPVEIGNHTVLFFNAAGIPHEMALFGQANYDTTLIKTDIPKIVEEEKKIFDDHPCHRYVFIVHCIPNPTGGLEHKNSCTLQVSRNGFTPGGPYKSFLSLLSHEYFHLWNVKRLRPKPLGPFDYDNENYTNMLFVAEGFTAYYDDLITRRCNFVNEELYLATIAGTINTVENNPGNSIQSLAESSFDAWIKYYRTSENNMNATVSYYSKGSLVACLLDLAILDATACKYRLDDVMKLMYDEYYKKLNRGYSDDEFISAVEKISGKDMKSFFAEYVYDTKPIPYKEYFSSAGLVLTDDNAGKKNPYLGINTSVNGTRLIVSGVERNSPAWYAGINVNDEIIAADNNRLTEDISKFMAAKKPGDKISFTITRNGSIKTIEATLAVSKKVSYSLQKMDQATPEQSKIYQKWIGN